LQPPDDLILEIGPRLEVPSVNFLAIQTHLSQRLAHPMGESKDGVLKLDFDRRLKEDGIK
jgi:hypothetical protein